MNSRFLEVTEDIHNCYQLAKRDCQRTLTGFANVFAVRNQQLNSNDVLMVGCKAEKADIEKRIAKAELTPQQIAEIYDLTEDIKTAQANVRSSYEDGVRECDGIAHTTKLRSTNTKLRSQNDRKQMASQSKNLSLQRIVKGTKDTITTNTRQMLVESGDYAKFQSI